MKSSSSPIHVVLLWKRLMGTKVFQTQVSFNTPHIRGYAHCGLNNGTTVVLINLSKTEKFHVYIDGLENASPRVEYLLTSDDIRSQRIYLNGVELQLTADDKLPSLDGKVVKDLSPITMLPLSYGFVHFPEASSGCN